VFFGFSIKMEESERKQNNLNKNEKKHWIYGIVILAVLVVGSFMLFSGGDNNSNISGNVVATVNGAEITSSDVNAVQQSLIQQGQQISEEEALEQAINQELVSQEVAKGDYAVSNEEAESAIEQQLTTQGATLNDYKQQVESQGISYEELLESTKEQLAVQNYLEVQLQGENFEVSEQESQDFYEMYKSQSPEEIPPFEELEQQIISTLQQQKQQESISSLIQELRVNAEINYLQDSGSETGEVPQEIPVEIQEQ
jgi:hypothetical protein